MTFLKKISTVFDQYPHMNNVLILFALLLFAFWIAWAIQEWRYHIIFKHIGAKNFEVKIELQKQELIDTYKELSILSAKVKDLENKIKAVKSILL